MEASGPSLFTMDIFKNSFIFCWVFVAVHGLSLVEASEGYSLAAVCRPRVVVASLVAEHSL